jgi:glyoxylase-like metal-dependent hydrolase (beta-lactamase superfamily II)
VTPQVVFVSLALAAGAVDWTAAEDHQNMMAQLGIAALRPGPSGNEQAPNHANYDEALANPFPHLPDLLTLKSGGRVTSANAWWKQRRPEIVEDFEREVYGRVPAHVPAIRWTVVDSTETRIANRPVLGRHVVGHVDNSADPDISVDIQLLVVTPADAKARVPVMMMFAGRGLPELGAGPSAQLIGDGWGYVAISTASIQADNGAGLTKGIIGLVNKGEPRKPDDWGALRAWAWGASRALDYLETDALVDAKKVGIEGVSRYGKAALVAMAFDTRFAVVLVGSSGEGGAKLHRRNWGEAVENLTGVGEYHWMAGNFLKYGTAASRFGSRNAGDLPVDAHELIALCAPRPTFISYGVPEKGDAKWLDHQGSFMAAIAAGPAFRLLGARDLGRSDDYNAEKMPAVNVGLLDGQLAWRQHDGGHTDAPNWTYFIPWADRFVQPAAPSAPLVREGATVKLTEHVWAIPDFNVGLVPNVGIIVGSKATLIVDTGLGPRNGATIAAEMKKVSTNRDVFVVLTHYHPEHSLGATAFKGATIVMTRVQQQDMAELGKDIQNTFASRSALTAELLNGVPYPTPDVVFDRDYRLDLGGVHARLLWRGPAAMHTRGDTMVFVEEDRVLFTGDVVMSQRFLAAQNTSSLVTWLATLDELAALKPARVVPSHGSIGGAELIARDGAFLRAVRDRVSEMKRAGKSMDEAVAAVVAEIAPKYPEWGNPSGAAAAARAAYAEAR